MKITVKACTYMMGGVALELMAYIRGLSGKSFMPSILVGAMILITMSIAEVFEFEGDKQ